LGAGLHGPEAARHLGMVHVIADDPVAKATDILSSRARLPAAAYAAAKSTLRGPVGMANPEGERAFVELVLPVWTSPQLKQTILGFLGKK
jgi:hypothetical protein